jgi:hypothetical protein
MRGVEIVVMDDIVAVDVAEQDYRSSAGITEIRATSLPGRAAAVPEAFDTSLLLAFRVALGNWDRLRLFEVVVAGRTVGWLLGVREVTNIALRLGPLALYRYAQPRLRLFGDYGFISGGGRVDESVLSVAIFRILRDMPDGDAVYLQAVAADSPMGRVAERLRDSKRLRVRVDYSERFRHRLVPDGDFDTYLQSRSKSTRHTFRYSIRRLREHCGGDVALEVFDTPETTDEFVRVAAQIAARTYQQQRLGLGIRNEDAVRTRLRTAAERGWMKSFILRCRGEPVAYIEGYQAAGTYFAYQIGFIPDWEKWSVGTVCQLEAIRHLIDVAPVRPHTIDYFEGDSEFKRRLSNVTTSETSLWILKRGFRGWTLSLAQSVLDSVFRTIRMPAKRTLMWLTRGRLGGKE